MDTEKKTDPVDALLSLLEKKQLVNCYQEVFFGGGTGFIAAVESERGAEIINRLKEIEDRLRSTDAVDFATLFPRWEILKQMAQLRAGNSIDISDLLANLTKFNETANVIYPPHPQEERFYEPLIEKLMRRPVGSVVTFDWTEAHWQLFSSAAELISAPKAPRTGAGAFSTLVERTPILIATKNKGWVMNLCVERRPGPPGLITPDWWKMGLFPLGPGRELLTRIHEGFQVAIEQYAARKRIQLRWWLEKHRRTSPLLFDTIEEAGSVTVAAACVARSLLEESVAVPRPVIDSSVVVSGTLGDLKQGVEFDKRRVGLVDYHEAKIKAAADACLTAVLLSAASEESLFTRDPRRGNPDTLVQPVKTLNDAYESLLVTFPDVAKYKQRIVEAWDRRWIMRTTPSEFTRGS